VHGVTLNKITKSDVRGSSKFTSVQLNETRMLEVLPLLKQTIPLLKEKLSRVELSKELEPASFTSLIKRATESGARKH